MNSRSLVSMTAPIPLPRWLRKWIIKLASNGRKNAKKEYNNICKAHVVYVKGMEKTAIATSDTARLIRKARRSPEDLCKIIHSVIVADPLNVANK